MRILIIEDEVTLSKTLAEGLKEYGYQNDIAESLTDGRYFLDIRNYDLVLLDWMLPDGNGIDLIPEIKEKRSPSSSSRRGMTKRARSKPCAWGPTTTSKSPLTSTSCSCVSRPSFASEAATSSRSRI